MFKFRNNWLVFAAASALAASFATAAPNIKQDVQTSGIAVVNTGPGNVTIGYTIEQHEHALKEQENKLRQELRAQYSQATDLSEEKRKSAELQRTLTERKIAEVERQLHDLQNSYQKQVAALQQTINELKRIGPDTNNTKALADAIAAAEQGDTSKAYALFAEVEKNERAAVERAATAAYGQGQIDDGKFEYQLAYAHYKRAIALNPNYIDALIGASHLARILGDVNLAATWAQQAEKILLSAPTHDEEKVAEINNALGSAWQDKGDYDQAIHYFEQALASHLKTFGEDHPDVARDRNNLGSAWLAKDDDDRAITYFEQALLEFERLLGENHPSTKTVAQNLEFAKRARAQKEQVKQ